MDDTRLMRFPPSYRVILLQPVHQVMGPDAAPWLTFVPGIGNDATIWQAQAASLSDRFRVITFDPWGHAGSPPPPQGCGFPDVVNGVVQLWDTLGVARSSVVGLGFAGQFPWRLLPSCPSAWSAWWPVAAVLASQIPAATYGANAVRSRFNKACTRWPMPRWTGG